MPVQTNTQKETLAVAYGAAATFGALFTTAPGSSPGTEVTGGSPAYARKALTWSAGASDGVVTASATFDVASGVTVVGIGVYTAVTGGTYLDGATITSTAMPAQGQLTVTFTFTQS